MVAVALQNIPGAFHHQRNVGRILRAGLHPGTTVEALADHHAVAVAGIEEVVGWIGDVLEIDQVQVRLGVVANLGVDPLWRPIPQGVGLDVAASGEDLLAVDLDAASVMAVVLVHLRGDLAHSEAHRLRVGHTPARHELQAQVILRLRAVTVRPPESRILHHGRGVECNLLRLARRKGHRRFERQSRFRDRALQNAADRLVTRVDHGGGDLQLGAVGARQR